MDFLKLSKMLASEYYSVPDYQRDYEWTNAQNSTLLEDVFAVMDGNDKENHFFGAIVTIPYEESNGINKSISFDDYGITSNIKHVVDGQQRLTSFSILMAALRDILNSDSTLDAIFVKNYNKILEGLLLGNDYDKDGNPAPTLILNDNTGRYYNSDVLNVRKDSSKKNLRGVKRIMAAYKLFSEEIKKHCYDSVQDHKYSNNGEYYKRLIDTIKDRLTFVEITCDQSSNAFQVFDSLNGKGLDLTASDRIKNIFLSWGPKGKSVQKWDALVGEVGDDYLAGFFVSLFFFYKYKRISKNRLPDEFKNTYMTNATSNFDFFFNNLKEDGTLYGLLRRKTTDDSSLNELLMDFDCLGFEQVYVILFAVAKQYGLDSIYSQEYRGFVCALLSMIVRMQVCEKSMNKLDALFAKCIDEMRNKNAAMTVITQMLKTELNNTANDDQFETSFASFAPSESKVGEFYLRHIEDYLREESGDRNKVKRNLTVEHIIPQTLDDLKDWYGDTVVPEEIENDFKASVVESIGNKMLLYGDDNASAKNHDYNKKLNVYKTGKGKSDDINAVDTFKLTKDLVITYPSKFNHDEVFERAKSLAEIAVKIWC